MNFWIIFKAIKSELLPAILHIVQFILKFAIDRIWYSGNDSSSNKNTATDGSFTKKNNKDETGVNTNNGLNQRPGRTRTQAYNLNKEQQQQSIEIKRKSTGGISTKTGIDFIHSSIRFILILFITNMIGHALYYFTMGIVNNELQYYNDVKHVESCINHNILDDPQHPTCKEAELRMESSHSSIKAGWNNALTNTHSCGNTGCLDFIVDLSPIAVKIVLYFSLMCGMIITVLYAGLHLLNKYNAYKQHKLDSIIQQQEVDDDIDSILISEQVH